jgi:3-mercaptopyruvate sulfurtransferase SseA
VEELKRQMDEGADMVVVDTLYPYWYRRGHIKGAINFPWAEVLREPTVLPRNKLLVLYCDCPCEETSADVAEQLVRDWGYKNIKVLKGGWVEWVKQGYPTEKEEKKR